MKDEAWSRFGEAINALMKTERPITSAALANEIVGGRFTEAMVSNWRRSRSHPPLVSFSDVVLALNRLRHEVGEEAVAPSFLLRKMGVALETSDTELMDKAFRLQKLELKIESANSAAAELGRHRGAATIVQAAVASGRWAVSVWPAYEGPEGFDPIHVADRIDIQRTRTDDRDELLATDVWADPEMKAALRAARALRDTGQPRVADTLTSPVSKWTIPNLASPRDALISNHWPGLPGSLCFASATAETGVNDVAAMVALQIGYGLTSVRDLVMDISGLAYDMASMNAQLASHDNLVAKPNLRRVWSYVGGLGSTDAEVERRITTAKAGKTIFVIHSTPVRPGSAGDQTEQRDNATLQRLADALPARQVIRLSSRVFSARAEQWNQTLTHTLDVLRVLQDRDSITKSVELSRATNAALRREPTVAVPIAAWLDHHGW